MLNVGDHPMHATAVTPLIGGHTASELKYSMRDSSTTQGRKAYRQEILHV